MMPDFALGVATTTIIGMTMTMTMRVNVDPPNRCDRDDCS
jgi:hypothetical protein